MPCRPRAATGVCLFAMVLAARLSPTASFSQHLLARTVCSCICATSRKSVLRVERPGVAFDLARKRRRRTRPAWYSISQNIVSSSIEGMSAAQNSPERSGDVRDTSGRNRAEDRKAFSETDPVEARRAGEGPGAPHRAVEAQPATALPATAGATPSLGSLPPPLTHDQLPDETIYLLDGTSMLFRAFYGRGAGGYLAPNGATEVGAVLAMGIEFAQFIKEVKPRYVAMAFDVERETTFRREIFPAYKAQRKPVPVDLSLQIPLAKALAEALGCRTFSLQGFEADDVMATLSRWGRSAGLGVVVCSSDKDMCQLVRDRVHVMLPRSNDYFIYGHEEVQAKFGVKPEALPDLFGLVGDAADNIPGVKGIGMKGGSRLLQEFGSLEGIFGGLEDVGSMPIRGSKGLQELLGRPGVQEEADLYREIATLHDEVPLDGMEDLNSSFFLYRGASPQAQGVMGALGFTAPLRIIQERVYAPADGAVPAQVGPAA